MNPRQKDLTGQRFGRLVVLLAEGKKYFPSGQSRMQWLCKCDCGNETIVDQAMLTSGHTQSCGCIVHESGNKSRKDLTNQRFGRLLAIEYVGSHKTPNGTHKSLWRCRCDCGEEVIVQSNNLLSGTTTSCGCYKKESTTNNLLIPMIGKKFGKLTVLSRAENDRFHHVRYLCQCDCGGQTIVDSMFLRSGKTTSCGCVKSKGEEAINKWLVSHDIAFETNYSIDDVFLPSGRRPMFDFVIFDKERNIVLIIEYNGIQHYQATFGWNTQEHFEASAARDREKIKQCAEKGYDVAIVPYTMLDEIDSVMSNIAKMYHLND